jgi:hypothetical protein
MKNKDWSKVDAIYWRHKKGAPKEEHPNLNGEVIITKTKDKAEK